MDGVRKGGKGREGWREAGRDEGREGGMKGWSEERGERDGGRREKGMKGGREQCTSYIFACTCAHHGGLLKKHTHVRGEHLT